MIVKPSFRSLLVKCLVLAMMGQAINALAAAFNINPVRFQLKSSRAVAVIQISNPTDEPVRLQINALDWTTDGTKEVLTDTDDLLVNPPIFLLAPNKTQYVRFGLRTAPDAEPSTEKSYRLMVEEVPTETAATGIRTLLRFSLPVFFSPKEKEEQLSWKLRKQGKQFSLIAINAGNVHAKINALTLSDDGKKPALKVTSPSYVLPGQHKEWPLESVPSSTKFRLEFQNEDGEKEEILIQGIE